MDNDQKDWFFMLILIAFIVVMLYFTLSPYGLNLNLRWLS